MLPCNRSSRKPRFPPSQLSPRQLPPKALRQNRLRLLLRQFAAWSCRKPGLAPCTRRPYCRLRNPAQATWHLVLDSSADDPSSTAALLALPAATRHALLVVALRFPASSPADLAPSILPAPPWAVPEPPAHPVHALGSVRVPDLAHLERVPASVLVPAVQAELHPPAKLPVRSAHLRVVAAGVRSIPRLKKAR
jgi:hypothetical protein